MVKTILSVASVQNAFETVIVNVTVPAVISTAPGVYVGSSNVPSSNVPSPDVVHKFVPFVEVAAKVYVAVSQIISVANPASAVGAGFIVNTMLSVASTQGALETVIVKVTVPAVISAAPGV